MRTILILASAAAAACIMAMTPGVSNAQATRTWVSGTGDDANPCSRTAPCKTFAGAISKTAPAGEISVIDPGGFGALTITKSITISGPEGFEAGVLVSGTNGIIVSAAATDRVILRGLFIEGVNTGLAGVRFNTGQSLDIQDSVIHGFGAAPGAGVEIAPSTGFPNIQIRNTLIDHNNVDGGVEIAPTGSALPTVELDNVQATNNAVGVKAVGGGAGINLTISNSAISGNTTIGVFSTTTTIPINVMIDNSTVANNGGIGIRSIGAASTVRVSRSTVTGNNQAFGVASSGAILSYGNNNTDGNAVASSPTGAATQH